MDIYVVWVEYHFTVMVSDKWKLMAMVGMIFVTIALMTVMRNRTISTQTEDGIRTPRVVQAAKSKAKTKAKAQPKSSARVPTQTEEWLDDTWLLEPDVLFYEGDEVGGSAPARGAASSSTEAPGPTRTSTTARRQATVKAPLATMMECSRQQHDFKVGRNSSSVFVTCRTCRHHVAWLLHSSGPEPTTVFDDTTNVMLQQAWTDSPPGIMKWVLIAIMAVVVLRLGLRLREHEWTARRVGVPRAESCAESRAESPRGEYAGEYVSEYVGEHRSVPPLGGMETSCRGVRSDTDHGAENLIVEMYYGGDQEQKPGADGLRGNLVWIPHWWERGQGSRAARKPSDQSWLEQRIRLGD